MATAFDDNSDGARVLSETVSRFVTMFETELEQHVSRLPAGAILGYMQDETAARSVIFLTSAALMVLTNARFLVEGS